MGKLDAAQSEDSTEIPAIELITEGGRLKSVIIDGDEKKIASPEATKIFEDLRSTYENQNADRSSLFDDSRKALREVIEDGHTPVFTIPREYIQQVLQNGLIPHPTYQKDVKILAGTIGIDPFMASEGRYIAILKNQDNIQKLGIQPRYTGQKRTPVFRGIIATLKPIPLSELIIIDSKDMRVVYPSSEVINFDGETGEEAGHLRSETTEAVSHALKGVTFDRERLDRIFSQYHPEDLIALLEGDFPKEFNDAVGVVEGYSLKEHTLMVLNQFEKYFADKNLPAGTNKNLFRLILALHDIGKPRAVREGDKELQHKYTTEKTKEILESLGYTEKEIKLALALVSRDPIGEFFKKRNAEESAKQIIELANQAGMDIDDFFELLIIFFKSDASSYTVEAGGIENLDDLFRAYPEQKVLIFSDQYQDLINELEEEIETEKREEKLRNVI